MYRLRSLLNSLRRGARKQKRKGAKKSIPTLPFKKYLALLATIVVGTLLVLLILKILVSFLGSNFATINDTKTVTPLINTTQNYAVFVLEDDLEPNRKFLVDCYVVSLNRHDKSMHTLKIAVDFHFLQPMLGKILPLKTTYNNAVIAEIDPYEALNSSLSSFLSMGINGYIVLEKKTTPTIANLLGFQTLPTKVSELRNISIVNQISLLVNLPALQSIMLTTLNREELLALVNDFSGYRLIKSIDLGNNFGIKREFATGTGLDPDYNLIDLQIGDILRSNDVLAEQIKVEVFNATNTPGLAFRTAKKLINYGVNVVRYSNAPRAEEISILYVPPNLVAKLNTEIIKSLVKQDIKVLNTPYEYNSTGDVVLVLGNDILK